MELKNNPVRERDTDRLIDVDFAVQMSSLTQ